MLKYQQKPSCLICLGQIAIMLFSEIDRPTECAGTFERALFEFFAVDYRCTCQHGIDADPDQFSDGFAFTNSQLF